MNHRLFWEFFYEWKSTCPTPLSADQYLVFLEALHGLNALKQLNNKMQLKNLMKICWMPDPALASDFDRIFDRYFVVQKQDIVDVPNDWTKSKAVENPQPPTPLRDEDLPPSKSLTPNPVPSAIQKQHRGTFSDFDLVITEDGDAETELKQEPIEHSFNLSDERIAPFQSRWFAQRLRKKIDNPKDGKGRRLDIRKAINEYADKGFISNIDFQKNLKNYPHIVFFADRFGTMNAYRFWEKQLEKSFKLIPDCYFEHYFFYNLPEENEEADHQPTQKSGTDIHKKDYKLHAIFPILLNTTSRQQNWDNNTYFFIFSDAGAHSGIVDTSRLKRSLDFWYYLNNISENVFWLNPVPLEMQNGCTARRLTFSIPMIYPDKEGLESL